LAAVVAPGETALAGGFSMRAISTSQSGRPFTRCFRGPVKPSVAQVLDRVMSNHVAAERAGTDLSGSGSTRDDTSDTLTFDALEWVTQQAEEHEWWLQRVAIMPHADDLSVMERIPFDDSVRFNHGQSGPARIICESVFMSRCSSLRCTRTPSGT
jgi:hypothetical protein